MARILFISVAHLDPSKPLWSDMDPDIDQAMILSQLCKKTARNIAEIQVTGTGIQFSGQK
jgi:hypothetical protein